MIYGNVEGVKNHILDELELMYESRVPKDSIANEELINKCVKVSSILEREISIAIDRKGNVVSVAIGDSSTVEVPIMDIKEKKLSGIRVIHTHPNGISKLSALDNSALLKLKLDCIAAIGIKDGDILDISLGFCDIKDDILTYDISNPMTLEAALTYNIKDKIEYIESIMNSSNIKEDNSEKAVIVGCDSEESLEELEELAFACNIPVLYKIFQNRNKIDSAYYVGSGKADEIAMIRQAYGLNLVIFDDELTGSQVRNLEEIIGCKVIDRTTLILEIFARRAKSREAKIQVELAQLKYRYTRLGGLGTVLSRTGGGIGTRGPGEKKLETDRRHIRERIYDLNAELEKVRRNREIQREKRNKQNINQVSIVGYTNAGKSTLRNKICEIASLKDSSQKEKVFEADMLFATLDTTTRAVVLPDNRTVTLTDTVGFIKKLPHELVVAFKSTLEEVIFSDILLHVVDASSENAMEQIEAVEKVLSELGVKEKPILLILNKIDKVSKEKLQCLKEKYKDMDIIEISAKQSINLDAVLSKISEKLPYTLKTVEYLIPYSEQNVVAYLHRNAKIKEEEYKDNGTYIKADVDEEIYNKCHNYILN